MVRVQKWTFFLAPKIRISARKSVFFHMETCFLHWNLVSPGRYANFETNGSSLRLFVPELRLFSWGESGRRFKKSSPTPLWGHRLPVTALALSAPGLDNFKLKENTKKSEQPIFRLHPLTLLSCHQDLKEGVGKKSLRSDSSEFGGLPKVSGLTSEPQFTWTLKAFNCSVVGSGSLIFWKFLLYFIQFTCVIQYRCFNNMFVGVFIIIRKSRENKESDGRMFEVMTKHKRWPSWFLFRKTVHILLTYSFGHWQCLQLQHTQHWQRLLNVSLRRERLFRPFYGLLLY